MAFEFDFVRFAAFVVVVACWLTFILVLIFRKKTAAPPVTRRISISRFGLVLQSLSYLMIWALPRREASLLHMPEWLQILSSLFAAVIAIGSVGLWLWALRALGSHWALVARVVKDHRLVTEGPYGLVRNPIYLSMFGMLLSTGLVVTHWWVVGLSAVIFLIGNSIRVRAEERLLRESFGSEFDRYASRVPAMFPRMIRNSQRQKADRLATDQ